MFRRPSFFIHAACMTSSFDVSPRTMSAIMSWTNWYLPIGCPNVSRSRAYSNRSRRRTTAAGAGSDREAALVESVHGDLEPLAFLADEVLGRHLDVLEEELASRAGAVPSASVSCVVTPFQPRSTTNAEIPLCFAAGSVLAKTSWWSATDAYEIQFFCR